MPKRRHSHSLDYRGTSAVKPRRCKKMPRPNAFMPKTHLWWNVFSHFSCRLSGIQHSAPYRRTERTHALYTLFLVDSFRSLSRKTAFLSAPKAFDACATLLLTSASIYPELSTKDPRYGNSSTASTSLQYNWGQVLLRQNHGVVCWYTSAAFSAPGLVDARWHHHHCSGWSYHPLIASHFLEPSLYSQAGVQVEQDWCHAATLA